MPIRGPFETNAQTGFLGIWYRISCILIVEMFRDTLGASKTGVLDKMCRALLTPISHNGGSNDF